MIVQCRDLKSSLLFTIIIATILFSSLNVDGCSYGCDGNQSVDENKTITYEITVTNYDHPFGVDVLAEVEQNYGSYTTSNNPIHLNEGETKIIFVHIKANTTADLITTLVFCKERDFGEDTYNTAWSGTLNTTVIHPQKNDDDDFIPSPDEPNYFFGIVGLTIIAIIGCIYVKKGFSLPGIFGYSRLRKDDLLTNPMRNDIYNTVREHEDGIAFVDILRENDIEHKNALVYHLKVLKNRRYIRRVGKLYYPQGVPTRKSFEHQIDEAIEDGASTPTEIARRLGTYRQKVIYHLKKKGK